MKLKLGGDQGSVSISTTDHPTGRWSVVSCYLSIEEWSVIRSDGPSCLLKQPRRWLKAKVGTFPIRLASFMSGNVKVILKTESHRERILTVILSLCVQYGNCHQ